MRFFLRSRRFKIICASVAALLIVSIVVNLIGGTISPHASIFGVISQPFRSAAAYITDSIEEFNTKLNSGEELMKENEKLQKRIDELQRAVVDYEKIKKQNEYLEGFLELKEKNEDFEFVQATLISRDNDNSGYMFTINKGTVNGIRAYDPVITPSGLVGYISEVGPSFAKVTTVLSDNINIGCVDYRTSDVGIVSGNTKIAKKGQASFYNLPRSCSVALNDIIVTVGGGIFPEGLVVGTISSISSNENQTSITATIDCSVDIQEIRDVMVITYFEGQNSINEYK